MHIYKNFLPVAALPQWKLSTKVAQLLGLQGPWRCLVCRDMDCLHHRSSEPRRLFFPAFCSRWSEGLFGQSFSIAPPLQALRGLPCLGSFSIFWCIRPPWLGSYSVVQCIRYVSWASLSIVQLPMLARGEREATVMALPSTCDSAVSPDFHDYLAFLHRHFPPQSSPSHSLNPPLHSQQQPSLWDFSTIPKFQLPAAVPSRRPAYLPGICMAAARTVWFSFHLGCHRSAVSFSALNVSPLTQTITPQWGSDPRFSSPTCQG